MFLLAFLFNLFSAMYIYDHSNSTYAIGWGSISGTYVLCGVLLVSEIAIYLNRGSRKFWIAIALLSLSGVILNSRTVLFSHYRYFVETHIGNHRIAQVQLPGTAPGWYVQENGLFLVMKTCDGRLTYKTFSGVWPVKLVLLGDHGVERCFMK